MGNFCQQFLKPLRPYTQVFNEYGAWYRARSTFLNCTCNLLSKMVSDLLLSFHRSLPLREKCKLFTYVQDWTQFQILQILRFSFEFQI